MDIQPIRTNANRRAALAEIDACRGAAQGTEAGDRLDVLLALVDACESRRWALTVEMIYKIREAWKIPADLLLRPCKLSDAA